MQVVARTAGDSALRDKGKDAAMTLLKCATHVVKDLAAACDRYQGWMDYRIVDQGLVPPDLAAAWLAPASSGRPFALLGPASGAQTFLRFVEGDEVPGYQPIRTYGWAAIELCVTDVEAVHRRMIASPFEVVGPPKPLNGFSEVKPMQVRGGDNEIVYLTQIMADGPENGLPRPQSLIDRPFIMVLAGPDLRKTAEWFSQVLGLTTSAPVAIRYSMINRAFGLAEDTKHELVTAGSPGDIFLEADQYPVGATARVCHPGALPPGVAMTTMLHPDVARLAGHWASPPVRREGPLYAGRHSGMVLTPEGALLEVIADEVV